VRQVCYAEMACSQSEDPGCQRQRNEDNLFVSQMRVAAVQISVTPGDLESNTTKMLRNRVGTDDGVTFCGTTMIIDPYGTVVASASAIHEGPIVGEINLGMIQTVRSQIKVHQDRRPSLYALST
jgi:predicted amidohydrolase